MQHKIITSTIMNIVTANIRFYFSGFDHTYLKVFLMSTKCLFLEYFLSILKMSLRTVDIFA